MHDAAFIRVELQERILELAVRVIVVSGADWHPTLASLATELYNVIVTFAIDLA